MDAYTKSCYPMAVHAVRDAISKDTVGQSKEAYCCYLSSILFMVQALKDEAWDKKEMKELCHDSAFKLYKLIEQSLGRARDILNGTNSGGSESQEAKQQLSSSLSAPLQSDIRPSIQRKSLQSTSTAGLIASLPTPPGMLSSLQPTSLSSSGVSSSYHAKNYDMFQAYKMRKSKDNILEKYASCDQNMSLFREMAEKKKISDIKQKAYQEKMLKRRQEIKIEAERRWNQMSTRSSRDKEYRQSLLEDILAYEEEARWPLTMRDTLVLNCENTSTITNVVRTVLTYNEHLLCRVLKEIQYEIYASIEPLIRDFKIDSELADDYYLVPVEDVANKTGDHAMPSICGGDDYYDSSDIEFSRSDTVRDELVDGTSHTLASTHEKINTSDSVEKTFTNLEDDMFSSDSENEEDNKPYNILHTSTDSKSKTDISSHSEKGQDEIYDHLWQHPETTHQIPPTKIEEPASEDPESIYQDPVTLHSTSEPSHYEKLTAPYQENIYEDVNEVVASIVRNEHSVRSISPVTLNRLNSNFLRTLDRVIQDILFGIDRLHSVILLTYENMDNPVGRDVSYANLECIFFKPLWPWVIRLFRKMNVEKENAMAEVMRNYKNCGPNIINVRDKLSLGGDQDSDKEPYLEAIEEMKQVVQFTSPLDKMECTVRVSKVICHCVETFYTEMGEKAPAIGCDDLLPILSYVVLKSQLPQIVSECHAMTEFIYDGYLMGEEGYCLTTLHAAISNLLSLAKPRV